MHVKVIRSFYGPTGPVPVGAELVVPDNQGRELLLYGKVVETAAPEPAAAAPVDAELKPRKEK